MKKRNFTITYHQDLQYDFQEAMDYYNDKSTLLGDRFYSVAMARIKTLDNNAYLYAVKYGEIRCTEVPKFPYLIHYKINESQHTVEILAVICTSKDPDKNWGKR